ncbi:tripartite tricarboxylate transporter TctB family protein [Gorillibacterium sp. sgz5001074]|uniref:tripartite tricarboxylate transporter TctB family protein n=1 Tax=Gorillibacterium sp. sgz5001074 TaxID=3446695 RepID=UPI003F67E8A1
MKHIWQDRLAGLLVLIAGALSLREAEKLYRFHNGAWIGDHVFPALVGAGFVVLGLILLVRPGLGPAADEGERTERGTVIRVAAVPAILLGYTLLLPWAGYLLGTFAAAALLFRTVGTYRWRICLPAALLVTVCLDLLFIRWLNTPLPAGHILWL